MVIRVLRVQMFNVVTPSVWRDCPGNEKFENSTILFCCPAGFAGIMFTMDYPPTTPPTPTTTVTTATGHSG